MSFGENRRSSGSSGGRTPGEPHPDCHHNFDLWRNLLRNNSDLVKLFFNKGYRVAEFFRDSAEEKSHVLLVAAFVDDKGTRHSPKLDLRDLRDEREALNPLCCQITWDRNDIPYCANVDFQQSTEDFKKQARYLLRVDM